MEEQCKVIYKYPMPESLVSSVTTPKGATFLNVKNQNDLVVAYFEVPVKDGVSGEQEQHHFFRYPTGFTFTASDADYIDTILLEQDSYVLHVYKQKKITPV